MKQPTVWLAVIVVAIIAAPAFAGPVGYTTIGAPHPGEEGHKTIIDTVYGVSVSQAGDGRSWTDTGFSAMRIADTGGATPLALLQPDSAAGPFDDQNWHNGVVSFTAEAVYAAYHQTFGFGYNTASTWSELFRVDGVKFAVTTTASGVGNQQGSSVGAVFTTNPLHWVRAGDHDTWTNNVLTSRIADNPTGKDQMVTYLINDIRGGVPVNTTWLVFWEDMQSGDFDYNDLVVEFEVQGRGFIVPEPVTMLSLFGGVVFLGRYIRRRTA